MSPQQPAPPSRPSPHEPRHHVRLVTASALFDGHDASINIMRRIMQSQGAEVVHLGHNRSVQEVVDAAIEEDVQGVAVSSYQGGHVEYFEYLTALLRENGAGHIKVVGGGGGVIVPDEIARLRESGVTIVQPRRRPAARPRGHDQRGHRRTATSTRGTSVHTTVEAIISGERAALARAITGAQEGDIDDATLGDIREAARPAFGAGARHHRHGRLGQELAHRRAGAPAAPRPAGQAARRRAGRRPHAQPRWWRPAR